MADSICFVATALSNTGKKGIIKPDSNGAYWMPVGALGVYNSQGHFYDYDESVKVFQDSSAFQRRVKSGAVRGEVGHPVFKPGMTDRQYMMRIQDIYETNTCCTHTKIEIVKDVVKDASGKPMIAIMSNILPSGVHGEQLRRSFENETENVQFSIRSLTEDAMVGGTRIRKIREVITFDQVNEPGISIATKAHSPSLEGHQEPILIIELCDHRIFRKDVEEGLKDFIKAKEKVGMESASILLSADALFNKLGWEWKSNNIEKPKFLNW